MCGSEGALKINPSSFLYILSVYWGVLEFRPANHFKIPVCESGQGFLVYKGLTCGF